MSQSVNQTMPEHERVQYVQEAFAISMTILFETNNVGIYDTVYLRAAICQYAALKHLHPLHADSCLPMSHIFKNQSLKRLLQHLFANLVLGNKKKENKSL